MNTSQKSLIIFLSIIASGCSSIPFQEAYPEHFKSDQRISEQPTSIVPIPDDVLASLPLDFQLAGYAERLSCFEDHQGYINVLLLDNDFRSVSHSKIFNEQLSDAIKDSSVKIYSPVGYPHIYCERPNVNVEKLFDDEFFGSWMIYLNQWQEKERTNRELEKNNYNLAIEINDAQKAIATTTNEISRYDTLIEQKKQEINVINAEIAKKRQQLGYPNLALVSLLIHKRIIPPFNEHSEYRKDHDPFISALSPLEDIEHEDKPWAKLEEMKGGAYFDPEIANQIDKVADAFEHPDSLTQDDLEKGTNVGTVKAGIKSLKARGLKHIKIFSGGRSPYRQATVIFEKAAKERLEGKPQTPTGNYNASDHLFGLAADMVIPSNWGDTPSDRWNSPNSQLLREIFKAFGLSFPKANDPNHFTLSNPSSAALGRQLAVAKGYKQIAVKIKDNQLAVQESALFGRENLVEKKEQLSKDLGNLTDKLRDRVQALNAVSAERDRQQAELNRLNAEIQRQGRDANHGPHGHEGPDIHDHSPRGREGPPSRSEGPPSGGGREFSPGPSIGSKP